MKNQKARMLFFNLGGRTWKAQTRALYPLFSLKIRFCCYLVESNHKATLNLYFKLRFSVKPSKFQIYFAKECRLKFVWNPLCDLWLESSMAARFFALLLIFLILGISGGKEGSKLGQKRQSWVRPCSINTQMLQKNLKNSVFVC